MYVAYIYEEKRGKEIFKKIIFNKLYLRIKNKNVGLYINRFQIGFKGVEIVFDMFV